MPLDPDELNYLAGLVAKAYLRGNRDAVRELIRILHEIDVLPLPAAEQEQVSDLLASAIDACRENGDSSIKSMTAAVLKVLKPLDCQQGEWSQHKGPLSRIVNQHQQEKLQQQLHKYQERLVNPEDDAEYS